MDPFKLDRFQENIKRNGPILPASIETNGKNLMDFNKHSQIMEQMNKLEGHGLILAELLYWSGNEIGHSTITNCKHAWNQTGLLAGSVRASPCVRIYFSSLLLYYSPERSRMPLVAVDSPGCLYSSFCRITEAILVLLLSGLTTKLVVI